MPQNQTVEHVVPKLVSVPTIVEEVVEELPKWVTPEGVKQDVSNTVPIPKQEPVAQPVITPVAKVAPVVPTKEQAIFHLPSSLFQASHFVDSMSPPPCKILV